MTKPQQVNHSYSHSARLMVDRDAEQLRLLGIYHFVVGGLNLVFLILLVLLPLIIGPSYYTKLGLPIPPGGTNQLIRGLVVGGLAVAIYFLNGWSMKNHINRISCMILSVIECLSIPIGLILGISAILVLRRDSVKELFERAKAQVAHQ